MKKSVLSKLSVEIPLPSGTIEFSCECDFKHRNNSVMLSINRLDKDGETKEKRSVITTMREVENIRNMLDSLLKIEVLLNSEV